MQTIQCRVNKIEALTNTIKRVVLTPQSPINFISGQYLQVVMGDKDKRPFSIANAPRADGTVELHIGIEEANQYAGQVLKKMTDEGLIDIEGGMGEAFLNQSTPQPTILLAGGTGFSYTLSLLQELLKTPLEAPLFLFWGTRTFADMYAFEELKSMEQQHQHFSFVPVVEFPEADWSGKTGWVHQAVLGQFDTLTDYQVYVAGRFEMAKIVREDFCQHGLLPNNLFGDAYAFI
jgi:aquacobalamin reductase/NAD(P)H-flavin reductase